MTDRNDMLGPARVWIVVAAYNEEPVVGEVVAQLRHAFEHVVVVDDCSTDQTGARALGSGAIVLRHPVNLGQGAALNTGMRFAVASGADFIVTFDADGQHRVEDIHRLINAQRETGADLVMGSRFLGSTEGAPASRELFMRLAAWFTWMTTGVRLSDAHNGLRLLTRHAAGKIRIRQNGMAHASEIVAQAGRLGLRVAEAPVTIRYTEYSLRKGQRLADALAILVALMTARMRK